MRRTYARPQTRKLKDIIVLLQESTRTAQIQPRAPKCKYLVCNELGRVITKNTFHKNSWTNHLSAESRTMKIAKIFLVNLNMP